VRIGKAEGVEGDPDIVNNPVYAAGVGLLLREAAENIKQQELNSSSIFHGIKSKMGGWLRF